MKPTYGRVPLRGVVPLAYSMDHVGTLARDVETATRGLAAIADPGPTDVAPIDPERLGTELDDLTVGWAAGFFEERTSDAVGATVRSAIDDLADAGAAVREVELPALAHSRQAWWGIAPAEFDDVLADVDVLAAPGTPTTALEIGGFERGVTPPVKWVTHPTNLTGHPSVVLPCDETEGLPVGLQFIGATGSDRAVLDAAHAYERL